MACGGCMDKARQPTEPFCVMLENRGADLPIRVESTFAGIRFHTTHAGHMLDLVDIVRSQNCRGVTGRAILEIGMQYAVWAKLAAPLAGETITLAQLQSLRR